MKLDIYLNGPIHATFYMCDDFYNYVAGTYACDSQCGSGGTGSLGAHAVIVVGWGLDDDGLEYWRIQNSWGSEWGDGGYVNIVMGKGAESCSIENWASAALPNTEGYSYSVAGIGAATTSSARAASGASVLTLWTIVVALVAFSLP